MLVDEGGLFADSVLLPKRLSVVVHHNDCGVYALLATMTPKVKWKTVCRRVAELVVGNDSCVATAERFLRTREMASRLHREWRGTPACTIDYGCVQLYLQPDGDPRVYSLLSTENKERQQTLVEKGFPIWSWNHEVRNWDERTHTGEWRPEGLDTWCNLWSVMVGKGAPCKHRERPVRWAHWSCCAGTEQDSTNCRLRS